MILNSTIQVKRKDKEGKEKFDSSTSYIRPLFLATIEEKTEV